MRRAKSDKPEKKKRKKRGGVGSYGSWKGQHTFISGIIGRQGRDDLILGDKTAAPPELEGILFAFPRCPRINFIGSDAVKCP